MRPGASSGCHGGAAMLPPTGSGCGRQPDVRRYRMNLSTGANACMCICVRLRVLSGAERIAKCAQERDFDALLNILERSPVPTSMPRVPSAPAHRAATAHGPAPPPAPRHAPGAHGLAADGDCLALHASRPGGGGRTVLTGGELLALRAQHGGGAGVTRMVSAGSESLLTLDGPYCGGSGPFGGMACMVSAASESLDGHFGGAAGRHGGKRVRLTSAASDSLAAQPAARAIWAAAGPGPGYGPGFAGGAEDAAEAELGLAGRFDAWLPGESWDALSSGEAVPVRAPAPSGAQAWRRPPRCSLACAHARMLWRRSSRICLSRCHHVCLRLWRLSMGALVEPCKGALLYNALSKLRVNSPSAASTDDPMWRATDTSQHLLPALDAGTQRLQALSRGANRAGLDAARARQACHGAAERTRRARAGARRAADAAAGGGRAPALQRRKRGPVRAHFTCAGCVTLAACGLVTKWFPPHGSRPGADMRYPWWKGAAKPPMPFSACS